MRKQATDLMIIRANMQMKIFRTVRILTSRMACSMFSVWQTHSPEFLASYPSQIFFLWMKKYGFKVLLSLLLYHLLSVIICIVICVSLIYVSLSVSSSVYYYLSTTICVSSSVYQNCVSSIIVI